MDEPTRLITVRPAKGRVVIRFAGEAIADSARALELSEEGYSPVLYLPRADVHMDLLVESGRRTRCPYKGEARYWSIRAGGREAADAAWAYEAPLAGVAAIAGHLAFYRDRVDAIEAAGA